jgi:5,10-methylenetetrahydromethanopterin reductase
MVSFGLGLFPTEPPKKMVELTKLGEDLGFACAYIGDSQMIWREAYVILGAAALATSQITLASGVTNPITRDPSVLAAAWDTLHDLTGGRTIFGIGMGDSSLETLGKKPATLKQLERAILSARALIAGETVEHHESKAPIHLTYARKGTRVPIYIGVSSPKITRLSGKVADGAIMLVGVDPQFMRASRHEMEEGGKGASRDIWKEGFRVVCWVPCSIQDDGQAAREAVKAHVARILKRPLPYELDPETMQVVRRIYEHYEYYEHMVAGTAHGAVVPDSLVEKFAIAGTPKEAREQMERLAATGLVDEIAIIPHTQDPAHRERIIRQVGEMIPAIARR